MAATLPPDRYLLGLLRYGFKEHRAQLAAFRAQMKKEFEHGGVRQIERTYDHWHEVLVAEPRRNTAHEIVMRAALHRVAMVSKEYRRRYKKPLETDPRHVARSIYRVMRCGRGGYCLLSNRWPVDERVRTRFLSMLKEVTRRRIVLHAATGSSGFGLPPKQFSLFARPPRIPEELKDMSVPTDMANDIDIDLEKIIDEALDRAMVARQEYGANSTLRDAVRQADSDAARHIHAPEIIGWQWTLSPSHPKFDECDYFADADAEHPLGAGVYFAERTPASHPNCWCNLAPRFRDELDDPDEDVSPPDDYDNIIDAIEEAAHDVRASAA